jgi:hypothetical protein
VLERLITRNATSPISSATIAPREKVRNSVVAATGMPAAASARPIRLSPGLLAIPSISRIPIDARIPSAFQYVIG